MGSSVSEWVADYFGVDYYTKSPRKDPKGPTMEEADFDDERVLRGGSYIIAEPEGFNISDRVSSLQTIGSDTDGFRCVKDLN